MPIPSVGNIADMADHLPAWADDALHLHLEEIRIVIDPSGQAHRVERIRITSGDMKRGGHFYTLPAWRDFA